MAKRAYWELRKQNLPGRLLLAAPRGLYHITEFLEMDAVMTAGIAIRQLAYDSPNPLTPGTAPTDEALEVLFGLAGIFQQEGADDRVRSLSALVEQTRASRRGEGRRK